MIVTVSTSTITTRWITIYNELLKRRIVGSAKDFCDMTGLSTSTITEILKGRTGVGQKTITATLTAFPMIREPGLVEGKGPLLKEPTPNKSLAKQILELKALVDQGIITEKEFEQGKRKILK